MDRSFLLITACKNEGRFLERCMRSVLQQTHRPVRWVINDDGSTDDTLAIARRVAAESDFIEVRQIARAGGRSFGAQYQAINAGYQACAGVSTAFVSFLDADTALETPQYFERLLQEFERDPQLGVAGGFLLEATRGGFKVAPGNATWTVAGGVQTFRRELFDSIGGYLPLELGGSDTLAEIKVRMKGWRTVSFPGLRAYHFRPPSSAEGRLRGLFKGGRMDASFGYHPAYAFLKFLRRLPQAPWIVGSFVRLAGFMAEHLSGRPPLVGDEVAQFLRAEQLHRLRSLGSHTATCPAPEYASSGQSSPS